MKRQALLVAAASLVLLACSSDSEISENSEISLEFEQYQLDNGLNVILHTDRSDPIAAVVMTFHVGSAREQSDRTGFAHLFEHLFFLDSENLGPGGLDRLMGRIGSATSGSTSTDLTNYFEVVPIDGLEKALWAEADKLGFFINTVTDGVLEKEKQVVKNEKRQRNDNAPYGHTNTVIVEALYPEDHPYSWPVIGSLAHLDAATLDDVREFHELWYGPNNATLAVAGDIDVAQTKAWVERYFGEIPARPTPESGQVAAVELDSTQRLFHEDNFARLPELRMTWPGVPMFHPDSYALDVLADLMSDGKATPLYELIVEENRLAPSVGMGSSGSELAGRISLVVRAHAGTDLDDVHDAVFRAFERFETRGVSSIELERVKAGYEVAFYSGLASVRGKAMRLTDYSLFAGQTDYINEHLRQLLGVSAEDIGRVYQTYIKDKPYVATSFVPRGESELMLTGSVRADVVNEPIVPGEGAVGNQGGRGEIPRTRSAIDRTIEPPFGAEPALSAPRVEHRSLDNGLDVLVIEDLETPLVAFSLTIKGGMLREGADAHGAANLLAEMLLEGTATKTPDDFELALDMLGASLRVNASPEYLDLSGSVLARNFSPLMELLAEVLLQPRWDAERLVLAKERVVTQIRANAANPPAIANDVFRSLVYGDHALARSTLGSQASVEAMTLEDLRRYHAEALVSNLATLHVVGAVDVADVMTATGVLSDWPMGEETLFEPPVWDDGRAGLYFVDVPGSAQSVVSIGNIALAATDPNFYPAQVMNYRLGGGGFASDLTQVLREQYGYTYGIRSAFTGSELPGPFTIQSLVRSNATLEALDVIKRLVEQHGAAFDAEDLDATRSYLLRSNASAFETQSAKLGMLRNISWYGFSDEYVLEREAVVRSMTIERIQELAGRYLDSDRMIWLVVGDAETQLEQLSDLGLGEPVLLERNN